MSADGEGRFAESRSARLLRTALNVTPDELEKFPADKILKNLRKITSLPAVSDPGADIRKISSGDTLTVLVACGSFSPVSVMHLRMFEMAADALSRTQKRYHCIGGFISPVSDAYGKKGLIGAQDRAAMCDLAVLDSDLIAVDHWESERSEYFTTYPVLTHFRTCVEAVLKSDAGKDALGGLELDKDIALEVRLLCGTDLLESINTPGVWAASDVKEIVANFGLVCIQREGTDGEKMVFDHDVLYAYRHNILFVRQWIPNDLSSTRIRQAVARGMSIKYLTPDAVIQYIKEHGLYGAENASARL